MNTTPISKGFSLVMSVYAAYALGAMLNPDLYSMSTQAMWVIGGLVWSLILTFGGMTTYMKGGNTRGVYVLGLAAALTWTMLSPQIHKKIIEHTVDGRYAQKIEEYRKLPKYDESKLNKYLKLSDREIEKHHSVYMAHKKEYEKYRDNEHLETSKLKTHYKQLRADRESMTNWYDKKASEYTQAYNKCVENGYKPKNYADIAEIMYIINKNNKYNLYQDKIDDANRDYPLVKVGETVYAAKHYPYIKKYSRSANEALIKSKERELEAIESKVPPVWLIGIVVYILGFLFETRGAFMKEFAELDNHKAQSKGETVTRAMITQQVNENHSAKFDLLLSHQREIDKFLLDHLGSSKIDRKIATFFAILYTIKHESPKHLGMGGGLSIKIVQKYMPYINQETGDKFTVNAYQMPIRNEMMKNDIFPEQINMDSLVKVLKNLKEI